MGKQSGKKVLEKYGREHFVKLGKVGFQRTTDLYFGGDRQAHLMWLQRKGLYIQDVGLSYHKPDIYKDPGLHPSEISALDNWLKDTIAKMDPNYDFSEG